jgi:hypothetical protein
MERWNKIDDHEIQSEVDLTTSCFKYDPRIIGSIVVCDERLYQIIDIPLRRPDGMITNGSFMTLNRLEDNELFTIVIYDKSIRNADPSDIVRYRCVKL